MSQDPAVPPSLAGSAAPSTSLSSAAMIQEIQAREDNEHLNLLAIFHYVIGGLAALASCVPLIHLGIGLFMVSGAIPVSENEEEIPMAIGWLFIVLAAFAIAIGMTVAVCILLAGKKLQQRKSRTYCMVVAGVLCIIFPLGTVLGVFTLMVLSRPSVKDLFDGATGAGSAAADFERRVG